MWFINHCSVAPPGVSVLEYIHSLQTAQETISHVSVKAGDTSEKLFLINLVMNISMF